MPMNAQGRPSTAETIQHVEIPTISGDRGLDHEEPLIFELGREGVTGVDIPHVEISNERLSGSRRRGADGTGKLGGPPSPSQRGC